MKLTDLDWGKLITNTFPGLLLALTIYMLVDVFSGKDLTAKAVSGDPAVLSASIVSLATLRYVSRSVPRRHRPHRI